MAVKKSPVKRKPQPSLSKSQEAALLRVYNAYWDSYIMGDVKAIAPLLDEQYTQVGSAESEVFFTKKDAVKFIHDTIDQIAGKADMRNRVIRVEPHKEFILITELTDLYVLIENNWAFHSKFRASSLMRKRKDGWKFYHQHSSFPDIRAQEGENMSIEKVALENLQLRDAVKRRTVELEQKTRDLKVEATLEHVRARAMAMRNSSELAETSAVLFQQVNELGINALRTSVGILDEANNAMELWLTAVSESKEVVRIQDYVNLQIHPVFEIILPTRKQNKPYALTVLKGNEVKQYYNTMSTYISLPKQQTYNPEEFFYSFFFPQGTINVVAAQALTEEECTVMARVANVFGVIYTRFLDLQKAEAQTREAQIELALERVRARTTAMHKSDELVETSVVLFQELRALGVSAIRTGVAVFDTEKETMELWSSQLMEQKQNPVLGVVPVKLHPFFDNLFHAWKRNDQDFTFAFSGEEVKEFYQVASTVLSYPPQKAYNAEEIFSPFFFPEGSLTVVSHDPLNDEERGIMRRFANVFGLLYRRFLDLQKAEAQAREAQIETSLERVRARTMAMHKSEELAEVAVTIHKELITLEVTPFVGCGYVAIDEPNEIQHGWTTKPDGSLMEPYHLPLTGEPAMQQRYDAWRRKDQLFYQTLGGDDLKLHIEFAFPYLGSKEVEEIVKTFFPDPTIFYCANFSHGYLSLITGKQLTEPEKVLFTRFRKVFEQSYARFLDLQKAEAQAREAEIQLALERVRARAMAMHHSDELKEVASVMREQFSLLGQPQLETVAIHIYPDEGDTFTSWAAIRPPDNPGKVETFTTEFSKSATQLAREMLSLYKSKAGEYTINAKGDAMAEWLDMLFKAVPTLKQVWGDNVPDEQFWHFSDFSAGTFVLIPREEPSRESKDLLKRSASVFDLAYRRYADLKKAEAQAREGQIQLAMERVRARTMAMQTSAELPEAANLLFQQVQSLGMPAWSAGYCIWGNNKEAITLWMSSEGVLQPPFKLPLNEDPSCIHFLEAHLRGETFYVEEIGGEALVKHYTYMRSLPVVGEVLQSIIDAGFPLPTFQIFHCAYFSKGFLLFITYQPVPEAHDIFKRFGKVFEQTYTRFLDLQKAEAQAREAQIEAALERVRSRSMAMHKSEELKDVIQVVFEQLLLLNIRLDSASFSLNYKESDDLTLWTGIPGNPYPRLFEIPVFDHPLFNRLRDAKAQHSTFLADHFTKEESSQWWKYFFKHAPWVPEERQQYCLSSPGLARSQVLMDTISLFVLNYQGIPYTEEENNVFRRFGAAFQQAYTRFLDLQKAEAQAREATLEASLERVRGKAMGMHNSGDLVSTIKVFYQELESLNLKPRRCGVGLLNRNNRQVDLSTISEGTDGTIVESAVRMTMEGHPVLDKIYENYLKQQEYHPVLRGNEIKKYNQAIRPQADFPDFPEDAVTYGHFFYVENHGVYAWTDKELSEDELKIYRRFTTVLTLTYKRYRELKEAEERARIAVRDASLDRVRAEIASMRHADDLQRITPLIWRELKTLGVPFFRCGVLIVNENKQRLDYYLSTPEGHPLAALHLDFNTKIEAVLNALQHWREQSNYIEHWNKEQFVAFARSMMEIGQIQTMKSYQGGDQPPESITLQFIPFEQGMLYVGSAEELTAEQIGLVSALADAFSTAYARYEDFTRLEAAKATVEKTLSELRTTQTQLVQSEKMASLGELTAGIAHEIQNPLNFVNNFSEVSKELLDEMEEELKKGNNEDALQIAKDIINNLEKINFHGKRADGIVKSMLQHSRKSSGQKESTDINALCDEYLRLSFHGLRAKDKSFNAKFESRLDPTLPKVNAVPQELGRVVLNLINNAFYAVSEKAKQGIAGYEPTVSVRTKRAGSSLGVGGAGGEVSTIEITVTDNGPGIPDHIKDKIFQPFFTTKPTGQGTGLGLSLSYDIITKGHGGELKVATKEGEGSEFTVLLPTQ